MPSVRDTDSSRETPPERLSERVRYRSEWRKPWVPDGRRGETEPRRYPRWLRALKDVSGLYVIRDMETRETLYVGRGRKDLKGAIVRHFNTWGEDRRGIHHRATYDRRQVEVQVYLMAAEWVCATEADLIALRSPRDNRRLESTHATCAANRRRDRRKKPKRIDLSDIPF